MGKAVQGAGEKERPSRSVVRIIWALEVKGEWCLQARHNPGVANGLSDGTPRCEGQSIWWPTEDRIGRSCMAGVGRRDEAAAAVCRRFARSYAFAFQSSRIGVFSRLAAGGGNYKENQVSFFSVLE